MKLLMLLSVYLLLAFNTRAQAISWLHGEWTGETYFPNGPITKRIVVKLRITKVTGSRFEAFLDNLYPNDTTIRLERKITGSILNKKMHIESSEQVYIRDPRTQNFWHDCTGCDIQSAFSVGNEQIEIKLKTTSCSDECNGETIFTRDTSELNPSQQKDLAKWFHLPTAAPLAKAGNKPAKASSAIVSVLPDHQNATLILQDQKPNTKDSSASASEPSVSVSTGLMQERKKDTKDTFSGASKPTAQQKPALKPARKKDTSATAATGFVHVNKDSLAKLTTTKTDSLPNALATRTTTLVNTFRVSSPHIVIQLFDNAEIDGDVVTVYHNGQMIVNRQSLTHKAITITIDASKENAHHEFIMTADNLGLIPPNTALMRIIAGEQKFELEVSSDFDNNSKITIDYTGE